MQGKSKLLNILDLCTEGTRALGPGRRYVVWTQGCIHCCVGCTSPEGISLVPNRMCEVSSVVDDILSRPYIDGITLSGGEPMLQAGALSDLVSQVRSARPDMTVVCFTGFLLEQLVWNDARRLLSNLDVLIDGPYVDSLNDGKGLRGSTNQRIHMLTDALADYYDVMMSGERRSEMMVTDQYVKEIGIPSTL